MIYIVDDIIRECCSFVQNKYPSTYRHRSGSQRAGCDSCREQGNLSGDQGLCAGALRAEGEHPVYRPSEAEARDH